MTVKAIETVYAGCRFRSRLEARWAVFFDTVGIRWQYEAQGYEIPNRLNLAEGIWPGWDINYPDLERPTPYLPDFYLPDIDTHVEVKGVSWRSNRGACWRRGVPLILNAAATFGRLAVVGTLSRPGAVPGDHPQDHHSPVLLRFHKGDLHARRLDFQRPDLNAGEQWLASDDGRTEKAFYAGIGGAIQGWRLPGNPSNYQPKHALTAARQARFEHGETPRSPTSTPAKAQTMHAPKVTG